MSTATATACQVQEASARALVELYAERITATKALALNPSAAAVDHILNLGTRLDHECETHRRRYYPRHGQVIVGLYAVIVISAHRRTSRAVLDLFDEYVQ